MLLRDRISAGSTTSRKPRLPMSEYQRSKPRSRKQSEAEIKVEGQQSPPPLPVESTGHSSPPTAACDAPFQPTRPPPSARLAAIYLPVSDLRASSEFYGDVLGLQVASASGAEEGNRETGEVGLRAGHGTAMEIVLYQSDCSKSKGKERLPDLEQMRQQYSLAVSMKEDVRRWGEWLREKSVDVSSTKGQEEESSGVLFRDPDGNVGKIVWRGNGKQE